jgi:hypothetical protein
VTSAIWVQDIRGAVSVLVIGNWERGHVPRSGNVRSVPESWEQSRSRSVKT